MDTAKFKAASRIAAFILIAAIAWAAYSLETYDDGSVAFRIRNEGKFLESIRGRRIILSVGNSSRDDIGSLKFTLDGKHDYFPHRTFYRNSSCEIELTDRVPGFQPRPGDAVKIELEFAPASGKKRSITREVRCD